MRNRHANPRRIERPDSVEERSPAANRDWTGFFLKKINSRSNQRPADRRTREKAREVVTRKSGAVKPLRRSTSRSGGKLVADSLKKKRWAEWRRRAILGRRGRRYGAQKERDSF